MENQDIINKHFDEYYEKKKRTALGIHTMPRCDIEELKEEIKYLKKVLRDCKQMFVAEKSFLVQCSRLEDINNIIEKIDEVLKW